MSYIRTKDAIYTLSEAYWAGIEDETIADADTIEELCDEFVAICPTNKNANYITGAPLKNLYETEYKKFNRIIYGAIWTGKGLIYVAKMNDKGELELL